MTIATGMHSGQTWVLIAMDSLRGLAWGVFAGFLVSGLLPLVDGAVSSATRRSYTSVGAKGSGSRGQASAGLRDGTERMNRLRDGVEERWRRADALGARDIYPGADGVTAAGVPYASLADRPASRGDMSLTGPTSRGERPNWA